MSIICPDCKGNWKLKKCFQCGHCGDLWEEQDKEKGFQCNCGADEDYLEESYYGDCCGKLFSKKVIMLTD